jgi:hypothetical protein
MFSLGPKCPALHPQIVPWWFVLEFRDIYTSFILGIPSSTRSIQYTLWSFHFTMVQAMHSISCCVTPERSCHFISYMLVFYGKVASPFLFCEPMLIFPLYPCVLHKYVLKYSRSQNEIVKRWACDSNMMQYWWCSILGVNHVDCWEQQIEKNPG